MLGVSISSSMKGEKVIQDRKNFSLQNKADAPWWEDINEPLRTTEIDEIFADVDPKEQNDQEQTTIGQHSPLYPPN